MSQIEVWEDENVMRSDSFGETDIHDAPFAYEVSHELLPKEVEGLDEPDDNAAYGKMFENAAHPRAPFAGICVAVGFDGERIYADLPGLAEDDTIYYADIWEVGHPSSGHNTLVFVAMVSDRLDDEQGEYETTQWVYRRALELFAEETDTPDYFDAK